MGLLMLLIMISYFVIFDELISLALTADSFTRIIFICALVIPPSFISGTFFPLGLKKVSKKKDILLPWAWGVDTLAFVTSGLIISFEVLFVGIKVMFVVGAFGYLIAALVSDYFE